MGGRESIGLTGLYNAPSSDDGLKSCGKDGGEDGRMDVAMGDGVIEL